VEIFLGRSNVNPNELSGDGKTPLWHAATAGHEGGGSSVVGQRRPQRTR